MHGPPATAASRGGVGGAGRRRAGAGSLGRQPHWRIHRHCHQRLRRPAARPAGAAGRLHRKHAEHRRQPDLLPSRLPRTEHGDRHRLLLVAGRRAPGLPQPGRRRVHPGLSRRRQRHAVAADRCRPRSGRAAGGRRPLQDVRRPGGRLRPGRGRRDRRAQAVEPRVSRRRPGLRGHPRQRRQPGWAQQRVDGRQPRGAGSRRDRGLPVRESAARCGAVCRNARRGNISGRPHRIAGARRRPGAGPRAG
ncbi:hypothetical protein C1Y40_04895 [Mycobacterium talmoniae]|uniref:Uncharacterized protein n=1 Tax=Mycobacterium talmoniae TaxID=1858794 RepID=A0A2S8BE60_9MYCO|nr:hypothetical protein C1Y40_04895 [Mycobacterium talmoniae]